MEKQVKLVSPVKITFENMEDQVNPEVHVTKNNYISAGAMVKEIIIRKTYVVPVQKQY